MADETKSLTDTTLARLQKLAQGNGLAQDAIQLVETKESPLVIEGRLRLTPQFESTPHSYTGQPKSGKGREGLSDFAALNARLAQERQSFAEGKDWVQEAIHEIESAPGYGWGQNEARLTLPHRTKIFSATEKCPACGGAGLMPCPQCQGQKHVICPFCFGKREEECYNCFGTGEDPVHKGQPCPICRGTRFAPCRYCQATGIMACPTCQGRGGLPCTSCQGTGFITQEVQVNAGANIAFQLGAMTDCPSGFLRVLDRVGVPNLVKGHADIVLVPQEPESDKAVLVLRATVPYAEMKIRFAGKGALVIAFGKKNHLSGVPAFLDAALAPRLKDLAAAAAGHAPLGKALRARALDDALKLVLARKADPNNLRRLYPVGLSPATAMKIMTQMAQAVKKATLKARLFTALFGVILSGGAFFGAAFPPARPWLADALSPKALKAFDVALPLLALGGTWALLDYASRGALARRHPEIKIAGGQDIGTLGYAALALVLALYGAARYLMPL